MPAADRRHDDETLHQRCRYCLSGPPSKPSLRKLAELIRSSPTGADASIALQEMAQSSDRVAAILATAWLDRALEKALLRSMISPLPDKERKELFDGSGSAPLASISAKIRLAYAIGVYGSITRDDLEVLSGLRNIFAHSAEAVSFDTPEIRERCLRLKAFEYYKSFRGLGITGLPKTPSVARSQFMASYLCIYFALSNHEITYWGKRASDLRETTHKLDQLAAGIRSRDYSDVDFDYFNGDQNLRIP